MDKIISQVVETDREPTEEEKEHEEAALSSALEEPNDEEKKNAQKLLSLKESIFRRWRLMKLILKLMGKKNNLIGPGEEEDEDEDDPDYANNDIVMDLNELERKHWELLKKYVYTKKVRKFPKEKKMIKGVKNVTKANKALSGFKMGLKKPGEDDKADGEEGEEDAEEEDDELDIDEILEGGGEGANELIEIVEEKPKQTHFKKFVRRNIISKVFVSPEKKVITFKNLVKIQKAATKFKFKVREKRKEEEEKRITFMGKLTFKKLIKLNQTILIMRPIHKAAQPGEELTPEELEEETKLANEIKNTESELKTVRIFEPENLTIQDDKGSRSAFGGIMKLRRASVQFSVAGEYKRIKENIKQAEGVIQEARKIVTRTEQELLEIWPVCKAALPPKTIPNSVIDQMKAVRFNPPLPVQHVLAAICMLKGIEPIVISTGVKTQVIGLDYWTPSKKLLVTNFKEHINKMKVPGDITRLGIDDFNELIKNNPKYSRSQIERAFKPCLKLYDWLLLMEKYGEISVLVKEKQELQLMSQMTEKKAKLTLEGLMKKKTKFEKSHNLKDED